MESVATAVSFKKDDFYISVLFHDSCMGIRLKCPLGHRASAKLFSEARESRFGGWPLCVGGGERLHSNAVAMQFLLTP